MTPGLLLEWTFAILMASLAAGVVVFFAAAGVKMLVDDWRSK